jgi:1-acyl-sn-glycerol-3-phosphate acyltransferase
MSIDGFDLAHKDAFGGFSGSVCEHVASVVDRLGDRLHVDIEGIDRLPKGRAILVANHAFGFWDLAFAAARIHRLTGRTVWSLGEHLWWKVPIVRRLASAVGVVDGTPANADALLQREELLLVLPGGLREAMKPHELRYRLLWGHRYGFIRAALRNRAPLVPLACIGGDDIFELVGDPYARGKRLHLGVPIPWPHHLLPRRVQLRFLIGDPIDVASRGSAEDLASVKSVRREVEGALHELIEQELAKEAGFTYRA